MTWVKGRHTMKAGVAIEYSGEDDFDQINVNSIPGGTNNQNGQFDFRNTLERRGRASASPTWRWACSPTTRRSASAPARTGGRWPPTSSCRTPGGRTSKLTVEGGVPLRDLAAVVLDDEQHRQLRPALLQHDERGGDQPVDGPHRLGPALQRHRAAGRRLRRRGQRSEGRAATRRSRRSSAASRAASRRRTTTCSSRGWACRTRWNDKTVLRGERRHLPQPRHAERLDAARRQPAVPADGHRVERQRRQPRRRRRSPTTCPSACRGRTRCSSCRRRTCGRSASSASCRWKIVAGRDLRRPPRRSTCSASATSTSCCRARSRPTPASTSPRCAPTRATARCACRRTPGDSKYNSLQISGERRYTNGFKLGVAYTLRQVVRQRQRQAQRPLEHVRRHQLLGAVELRPDARAGRLLHLRPAVLARPEHAPAQPARRLADLRGHVHPVRDAVLDHADQRHRRRRRRQQRPAGRPRGRHRRRTPTGSSRRGPASTTNFSFNPTAFANPAAGKFGNSTRNILRNPGAQQWDIALFKNFVLGGTHRLQFRAEVFNFINHPNLSGPNTDITNPNFGRIITKDGIAARHPARAAVLPSEPGAPLSAPARHCTGASAPVLFSAPVAGQRRALHGPVSCHRPPRKAPS